MSSHHIVRDEQEPSLLIHAINQFNWPVVQELLEWSPTVVVVERYLDKIMSLGHKVDIALVDNDRISHWYDQLQLQLPVEIHAAIGEEIWPIAIKTLIRKNHKALNVVTKNEFLFPVINQLTKHGGAMDLVIYTEDQKHILSKRMLYKKWLPAFSQIALVPLNDQTFTSTEGFDLDLDNEKLSEGISLSKKMEGEVTIKMTKIPFLISESLS